MSALQTYFQAFANVMRGEASDTVAHHLCTPELHTRMVVYRNTALRGQIDALAAAYPTVKAAMDAARFEGLARAYVEAHPARSRSFALYGAGLAAFITTHAEDAPTRMLADLAALDRAWLEAHSAADEAWLEASQLHGVDLTTTRLRGLASARCIRLGFDSHGFWSALKAGLATPPSVVETPTWALVWRPAYEVVDRAISPAEAAFFTTATQGFTLADAVEAAQACDPGFDTAGVFAGMLAAGVFSSAGFDMLEAQSR